MDYDRRRNASYDDYGPRDPRAYGSWYSHDTPHHVPLRGRSHSSSNAASDNSPQPAQQPLKSAIGNAFDQSDAARTVDPDLIAQIAAEVKKSVLHEIKQSGIAGASPAQSGPAPPQQHIPPSPDSTSASFPARNVYAPPSPFYQDAPSQPSSAQDLASRGSTFDGGMDDLLTSRYDSSVPIDIPRRERAPERPAPAMRMATDDFTPIEKMWQRLFDLQGRPLPRLGEFLRGLAMHLIEDYEPKRSLVISPAKMQKFYEDVQVLSEVYPWQTIFGELSYAALSKVYQSMRCQHHLIQEHPAELPYIPALTPKGFEEWMTAMILAYPDTEHERITKAVLGMPISNADNTKERFPKELPRRMFPRTENVQAQQRCAANLSAEGVSPLRKVPTFPPPPPPPKVDTSAAIPSLERERSPYSGQPDLRNSDSEGEHDSSFVPIERQRNPYSANPSGGKVYDDLSQSTHSDTTSGGQRRRAQSTVNQSQCQWAPPPPNDTYNQQQPRSSARRTRSPSFSSYGTNSDSNINDMPASHSSSNLHNVQDDGRRRSKDEDMRRQNRHRGGTVGTDSLYDSQPRTSYDDYKGRTSASGYEDRSYDSRRY
ncbi:uncharacterized protein EKO05_0006306 [Ascochyta rabiei]|uniref:DUF7514 domain-containing protein n=1 Tax=Didymella rabiei TaxID=5454 RepID=A0A163APE4_DIDRA|nr:uncharacterized protein EKO05_0006306 [Ascochyta rabiei]KZM21307.1 hypothetical protein ST47_g7549 [Ascochyta rabiei]UPX15870.1 hypothetical protein EKO05_0006306 [Ascochyta rabiei]